MKDVGFEFKNNVFKKGSYLSCVGICFRVSE